MEFSYVGGINYSKSLFSMSFSRSSFEGFVDVFSTLGSSSIILSDLSSYSIILIGKLPVISVALDTLLEDACDV